jgi:hypothetical protein
MTGQITGLAFCMLEEEDIPSTGERHLPQDWQSNLCPVKELWRIELSVQY